MPRSFCLTRIGDRPGGTARRRYPPDTTARRIKVKERNNSRSALSSMTRNTDRTLERLARRAGERVTIEPPNPSGIAAEQMGRCELDLFQLLFRWLLFPDSL